MTSYLPVWILLAAGLLLLATLVVRGLRSVRRFRAVMAATGVRFADERGLIRARSAAMRVAMKETRERVKRVPADVGSVRRDRQEDDRA